MPLTNKDIRTDEQLVADGFSKSDIREFRGVASEYFGALVELDEATAKDDYETVNVLDIRIEYLELKLTYWGKNPKEIPVSALRHMVDPVIGEDPIKAKYFRRVSNPATALRAFCIHCMNGQTAEIRRCQAVQCPLWPFRMGGNPFFGKVLPPIKHVVIDPEDDVEVEEETTNEVDFAD